MPLQRQEVVAAYAMRLSASPSVAKKMNEMYRREYSFMYERGSMTSTQAQQIEDNGTGKQSNTTSLHSRKKQCSKGDVPTSKVAAHTDVGDTDSAPIDPPLFLAPSPAPGFLRAAMSVCRSRTRPGTSAMGNGGVSACLISRTDCM